jgi:hypothetical protein
MLFGWRIIMYIHFTDSFVMGRPMLLGEIAPKVLCGGFPSYIELILCGAITHPVEMHIYCFVALLFARTTQNGVRDSVVCL